MVFGRTLNGMPPRRAGPACGTRRTFQAVPADAAARSASAADRIAVEQFPRERASCRTQTDCFAVAATGDVFGVLVGGAQPAASHIRWTRVDENLRDRARQTRLHICNVSTGEMA